MRTLFFPLLICLLGTTACNRTVDPDQLGETCARRLADRTQLGSDQIERFCGCFIAASQKKVSAERLADEFENGGSSVFKDALQPEFDQCKAQVTR